jgi:hypothetical protein
LQQLKKAISMEDNRTAIYDAFEVKLRQELIKLCTEFEMMNGKLLHSDDIDAKWDEFGRDYMIDAVHEFNSYPEVALAWAGFLGMGVARHWDEDWRKHASDTYASYYGRRGFDDMDDHILLNVLGYALDSDQAKAVSSMLSRCAALVLTLIRHEGFESQSVEAYYVLIRCVKVMYQIGASVELYRLGYSFQPL